MDPVAASAHVALDAVRQHSVGNHPADHSGGQHRRKAASPNVDDGDGHEGWGPQSCYDIDVARGEVQDPVVQIEAAGKEGALAAQQHLVWALPPSTPRQLCPHSGSIADAARWTGAVTGAC